MESAKWKRPNFIDEILKKSQFNKDESSDNAPPKGLRETPSIDPQGISISRGLRKPPAFSSTSAYSKGLTYPPVIEGLITRPNVTRNKIPTIRFVTEKIPNFYISEISDRFIPGKKYGGAIIYETGTYQEILPPKPVKFWSKTGLTCGLVKQTPSNPVKPGYVIILDTSSQRWKELDHHQMEAQVHGAVIYMKFKLQPSTMKKRYGMVFGGFSIDTDSVVQVRSYGLNTGTEFQDFKKEMHPVEADLLRALVHVWIHEFKGKPGVNISAENVVKRKEKEDEWNEDGWV